MSLLKSKCDRKRRAKFVRTTGLAPATPAAPLMSPPVPLMLLPPAPPVLPPGEQLQARDSQAIEPSYRQPSIWSNALQQASAAQSSEDEEDAINSIADSMGLGFYLKSWLLAAGLPISVIGIKKLIDKWEEKIRRIQELEANLIHLKRQNDRAARQQMAKYEKELRKQNQKIQILNEEKIKILALASDAVNKAEELKSLEYELSLKNQQLDIAGIRINRINSEKQSALDSIDSEVKKRDGIMEEFERQKEAWEEKNRQLGAIYREMTSQLQIREGPVSGITFEQLD